MLSAAWPVVVPTAGFVRGWAEQFGIASTDRRYFFRANFDEGCEGDAANS